MEGSMDCQGNNNHHRKKPTPAPKTPQTTTTTTKQKEPALPATSHFSGQVMAWDGSTYMPCLSTCLSHSEPCENARPQNSHGKRFSVLIAAPWSENLIRSVRRKQNCYLCAVGGGRRVKSTFIRKPPLLPALVKPSVKAISRFLTLSPPGFSPRGVSWLVLKNHPWFPGPQPPHASSRPQLLPSQIIWGFLVQRTPNSVSAGLSAASPPSGTLCQ